MYIYNFIHLFSAVLSLYYHTQAFSGFWKAGLLFVVIHDPCGGFPVVEHGLRLLGSVELPNFTEHSKGLLVLVPAFLRLFTA